MSTEINIREIVRSMVGQVREVAPVAGSGKQGLREQPIVSHEKKEYVKSPAREEVERVAEEVQTHLKRLDTELKIEVDSKEDTVVVKIMDPETNDIIRQVPPEEIMAIRERMKELIGILYDVKT